MYEDLDYPFNAQAVRLLGASHVVITFKEMTRCVASTRMLLCCCTRLYFVVQF